MWRICTLALAILSLLTGRLLATDANQPNIVFIMLDDLGATDLGCTGSQVLPDAPHRSPGRPGHALHAGLCGVPRLLAHSCSAAHGAVSARLHLTDFIPGEIDPRKHKLLRPEFHQELPLETVTLAERLQNAGYLTAAIGKWHLGAAGFEPQRHGFEIAMGGFERGSVQNHFAPYLKKGGNSRDSKTRPTASSSPSDSLPKPKNFSSSKVPTVRSFSTCRTTRSTLLSRPKRKPSPVTRRSSHGDYSAIPSSLGSSTPWTRVLDACSQKLDERKLARQHAGDLHLG